MVSAIASVICAFAAGISWERGDFVFFSINLFFSIANMALVCYYYSKNKEHHP